MPDIPIVTTATQTASTARAIGGSTGDPFTYKLRVRGAFPRKKYTGGTPATVVSRDTAVTVPYGATYESSMVEEVRLTVSDPSRVYFLNGTSPAGTSSDSYNHPFDYDVNISAKDTATLTLSIDNMDKQQFQGDGSGNAITVSDLGSRTAVWARVDFVTLVP